MDSDRCMHMIQTFMIVIACMCLSSRWSNQCKFQSPMTQLLQWQILPFQPTVSVIWYMICGYVDEYLRVHANTIIFEKYGLRIHEIERSHIGTFITTHDNILVINCETMWIASKRARKMKYRIMLINNPIHNLYLKESSLCQQNVHLFCFLYFMLRTLTCLPPVKIQITWYLT